MSVVIWQFPRDPPRKIGDLLTFKELVKNGPKTFKEGCFYVFFCVLDARQQADLMFFISENAISLNVYSIRESLSVVSQNDQFTCFYHAFGAIARADCQLDHF